MALRGVPRGRCGAGAVRFTAHCGGSHLRAAAQREELPAGPAHGAQAARRPLQQRAHPGPVAPRRTGRRRGQPTAGARRLRGPGRRGLGPCAQLPLDDPVRLALVGLRHELERALRRRRLQRAGAHLPPRRQRRGARRRALQTGAPVAAARPAAGGARGVGGRPPGECTVLHRGRPGRNEQAAGAGGAAGPAQVLPAPRLRRAAAARAGRAAASAGPAALLGAQRRVPRWPGEASLPPRRRLPGQPEGGGRAAARVPLLRGAAAAARGGRERRPHPQHEGRLGDGAAHRVRHAGRRAAGAGGRAAARAGRGPAGARRCAAAFDGRGSPRRAPRPAPLTQGAVGRARGGRRVRASRVLAGAQGDTGPRGDFGARAEREACRPAAHGRPAVLAGVARHRRRRRRPVRLRHLRAAGVHHGQDARGAPGARRACRRAGGRAAGVGGAWRGGGNVGEAAEPAARRGCLRGACRAAGGHRPLPAGLGAGGARRGPRRHRREGAGGRPREEGGGGRGDGAAGRPRRVAAGSGRHRGRARARARAQGQAPRRGGRRGRAALGGGAAPGLRLAHGGGAAGGRALRGGVGRG
mmetsp:Transcript_27836/g.74256  ORF Transcript_27836/g.74256 Transcript_27836/m.74256 type:complete len:582 (+) Transcript_27836:918-2663(+)